MGGDKSNEPRIVEAVHGLNNRNTFVNLDDLEEWRKRQSDDLELYSSYFRYFTDDPNIGGVLAGFGMDFDDEQNPERARKEAVIIVRDLMNRFDIDENSISICFSGNKGFHIFVNRRVFGVEPEYFLPKIYKSMAQELAEKHGLKTLDLKIYDRRRLIRLPGSRHQKSGLYKIPMTREELERFNIDRIRSIAVKPRPLIVKNEHRESEKARAWYLQHRDKVISALREKRIEFTERDFKGEIPPCVKKRLESGSKEGERNHHAWQLASYLYRRGLKKEETLRILEGWRERCERGLHPFTREELERTVERTYAIQGYGVGCGSEAFEPLCAGKENCNLFKGEKKRDGEEEIPIEAYMEAERILSEGDPLEYIRRVAQEIHAGDDDLIKLAYVSALSVKLSRISLHLWGIGQSQTGKSHLLRSVIQMLPRECYEVFTSASPLSLFYYVKEYGEDALDGKLIFIDEVESSRLAIPMLRSLTGQTEITPRHLSVYEGDLIDLKIVGRRVIWFTSTKTIEDDQIRNRFIFINPDESKEQDEAVFKLQMMRFEKGEEKDPFIVAKALTKIIIDQASKHGVVIPYLNAIKWPFKERRWLFPMFLSTIETVTKINFKKRKIMADEKVISEVEDFEIAKRLWEACIEHIIIRIGKSAGRVLKILGATPSEGKTRVELSEELGLSTRHVTRLLDELEAAGAINSRIKPGTRSLEFWRAPLQALGEISLDESMLFHDTNDDINYDKYDIGHRASNFYAKTKNDFGRKAPDRMSNVIDDISTLSSDHVSPIIYSNHFKGENGGTRTRELMPMGGPEATLISILRECDGEAGLGLVEAEFKRRRGDSSSLAALLKKMVEQGLIEVGKETVKLKGGGF